jgi:hypothetical protein
MAKISSVLREKARRDPQKVHRVLIVVDKDYNPEEMAVKIKEKWMGNILLADLKGAEITQLDMNPSVQSIEEDGPVSASSS